jgi:hypothetical protein
MKRKIKILILVLFFVLVIGFFYYIYINFRSHVGVNIPNKKFLQEYLERDLNLYFKKKVPDGNNLEYIFISDIIHQSGLSYPKYYLLVFVKDIENQIIERYLVRVSLMDKDEFYITDSFTVDEVKSNSEVIKSIFPEDVINRINTLYFFK